MACVSPYGFWKNAANILKGLNSVETSKKRGLHGVNKHFEPNFDTASASAVAFQPPARSLSDLKKIYTSKTGRKVYKLKMPPQDQGRHEKLRYLYR